MRRGVAGDVGDAESSVAEVEPDAPGGVRATVLDVSYFGHDALVRLELQDGQVVIARPPGYAAPRVGDAVSLVVNGPVHAFTR